MFRTGSTSSDSNEITYVHQKGCHPVSWPAGPKKAGLIAKPTSPMEEGCGNPIPVVGGSVGHVQFIIPSRGCGGAPHDQELCEPAFFCKGSKIFPHEQSTTDSVIVPTVGPHGPLPSQEHVHVHTSLINPSVLVVVSHDMAAWSTPFVCRSNLELSHPVGHSLLGNVDSLARRPLARSSPLQPVSSAPLDIERCLQTRSVRLDMTTSLST